ncbi:Arf-GAP domain-containing protein [Citrus sinensis]|nr:Arf-GAP domain-containing protein [Citrus sinensis]
MGNKIKEDERIEGIIRGLLKLPENRRCINCNCLGPQYVCTTFLTFVCTNCSGVHREFTHRVKSISMAKFSAEEVSALQAAGNEVEFLLIHMFSSSNLNRIRDFIKHVYVDRRYAGEKTDKFLRLRLGEKEDSCQSNKVGAYIGEFRSPRSESRYEQSSSGRSQHRERSNDRNSEYYFEDRRSPRYYIEERRSPGYNQENPRFGGHSRKTPACFEIVDDRFRDDVSASRRRSDSISFTNTEHKSRSMSPEYQKNTNNSRTLVVRPIKEILGENAPSLEVGKCSKASDGKDADDSANNQIAPSGSQQCDDGNPVEQKKSHSESLENSSTDPEPTDTAVAAQQTQPITPSDGDNEPSTEQPVEEKAPVAPPPNTLEFLLFELGASFMQSTDETPPNVSGSNTLAAAASSSNTQPMGGNMPEASVSPPASVEFPSCAEAPVTASTINNSAQQSGVSISHGGTSPAITSGQMSASPSSFAASTNASTTNLSEQPSGDNVPQSSASPAPSSGQMTALPNSVGDSTTESTAIVPVSFSDEGPPQDKPVVNVDSTVKFPDVQQLNGLQQHQTLESSTAVAKRSGSAQQTTTPIGHTNNQPWASLLVPNNQGPCSASAEQSSLALSKPAQDTSSSVGSRSLAVEPKVTGRKELPADLFTASYMPPHAPIPHWQTGHAYGTGFNTQYYPTAMVSQLAPAYSNPAKSTNPFDISSDTTPLQAPPRLLFTYSASMGFIDMDKPCSEGMNKDDCGFITFVQVLQGIDSFGGSRAVYGSSNTPQQPTGGYPVPAATNSFSMGGNPFG